MKLLPKILLTIVIPITLIIGGISYLSIQGTQILELDMTKLLLAITLAGTLVIIGFLTIIFKQTLLKRLKELQETTRALEKSTAQNRAVVETAPNGIITINEQGQIQSFNPAAERIFGYSCDEVIDQNVNILMPEPYRSRHDGYIQNYHHTGKAQIIGIGREVIGLHKNGTEFPIYLAIGEVKLENESLFTGIVIDITERKEYEEKLRESKEEAEKTAEKINQYAMAMEGKNMELEKARADAEAANKAKSQFLANISHEIRTPMNAVIGFSELLASLITDKKQKIYIEYIQTSGKSLLNLINDILDLSKVEAGMLEIQYEPTSLHVLIEETEQIFRMKIEEKNLRFLVDIDPELPTALMLDEVRLRQALINLVGNAVKFTETGHIKLTIRNERKIENQNKTNLIITVEDTGIGVPLNQQELIFESFRQQDGQSTRKFGGTGLGLSLTKKLIELMNGHISVQSTAQVGSVFTIRLYEVDIASVEAPVNKKRETIPLAEENQQEAIVSAFFDAQECTVPPALMERLENEIKTQWERVKNDGVFDTIEAFAKQLLKLGEEHAIPPIIEFGETLRSHTENFDIEGMNATLNTYLNLLEQLKSNG